MPEGGWKGVRQGRWKEGRKILGVGVHSADCQGFGGSARSLGLVFPTKEPLRVI